jgi:hypothetical protein
MSARKIDWVGSENTTWDPFPRPSSLANESRCKALLREGFYQVKTVSSEIRISGWPSPVISTNRRFGSLVLIWNRLEPLEHPTALRRALVAPLDRRTAQGPNDLPQPNRAIVDAPAQRCRDGFGATGSIELNVPLPRLRL